MCVFFFQNSISSVENSVIQCKNCVNQNVKTVLFKCKIVDPDQLASS